MHHYSCLYSLTQTEHPEGHHEEGGEGGDEGHGHGEVQVTAKHHRPDVGCSTTRAAAYKAAEKGNKFIHC